MNSYALSDINTLLHVSTLLPICMNLGLLSRLIYTPPVLLKKEGTLKGALVTIFPGHSCRRTMGTPRHKVCTERTQPRLSC